MWGHVLFWAFLTTTAIYLVFGVVCAVGQRAIRKGLFSLLLPVLYLGYGELKVLFTDAIASKETFIYSLRFLIVIDVWDGLINYRGYVNIPCVLYVINYTLVCGGRSIGYCSIFHRTLGFDVVYFIQRRNMVIYNFTLCRPPRA